MRRGRDQGTRGAGWRSLRCQQCGRPWRLDPKRLDLRKRLEELVTRVEVKKLTADEIRILRAIDVLEPPGRPRSRVQVLKEIAAGAAGSLPTIAAAAAVKRAER